MKVDFVLPKDGVAHRICLRCHADGVDRLKHGAKIVYVCPACGNIDGKALYWGVSREWVADDGELWHEAAAVFVRDRRGRVLLYERTEYPYGLWTVPAGHIDTGESPEEAARRELHEEAGIRAANLRHALTLDMLEAECSAGADAHRWHVYVETVDQAFDVAITDEEGRHPQWIAPEAAMQLQLLPPVRRLLQIMDLSGNRSPITRPSPTAASHR